MDDYHVRSRKKHCKWAKTGEELEQMDGENSLVGAETLTKKKKKPEKEKK